MPPTLVRDGVVLRALCGASQVPINMPPWEGSIWVPPWGEPSDRIMGKLVQYERCAFLPSLLPDSSAPAKEDSETAKERS